MRTFLFRVALPAALVLAAVPARAQSGNQSDIPPTIGGGAGGGSFLGPGMRTENELFADLGRRTVFRSARLGCALRTAESAYGDSVRSTPRTPAELAVFTLLGVLPGIADQTAVEVALAHGAAPGSEPGRAAARLAAALNGLMRPQCGCVEKRDEYVEAPQWKEALRAYNAYLRVAPDGFFAPPAPELIAIHTALQHVVYGTLEKRT